MSGLPKKKNLLACRSKTHIVRDMQIVCFFYRAQVCYKRSFRWIVSQKCLICKKSSFPIWEMGFFKKQENCDENTVISQFLFGSLVMLWFVRNTDDGFSRGKNNVKLCFIATLKQTVNFFVCRIVFIAFRMNDIIGGQIKHFNYIDK